MSKPATTHQPIGCNSKVDRKRGASPRKLHPPGVIDVTELDMIEPNEFTDPDRVDELFRACVQAA